MSRALKPRSQVNIPTCNPYCFLNPEAPEPTNPALEDLLTELLRTPHRIPVPPWLYLHGVNIHSKPAIFLTAVISVTSAEVFSTSPSCLLLPPTLYQSCHSSSSYLLAVTLAKTIFLLFSSTEEQLQFLFLEGNKKYPRKSITTISKSHRTNSLREKAF